MPRPANGATETDGAEGAKIRTWYTVRDCPIFAQAGLWRIGADWEPMHFSVMAGCNEVIWPVNKRMPVPLHRTAYDQWLNGTFDGAFAFEERCFPDELTNIERTGDLRDRPPRWNGGMPAASQPSATPALSRTAG